MYASLEEARKAIGNAHFPGCDVLLGRLVYQSRAGTPVSNLTPAFLGQMAWDSANSVWYQATGLTSADWKQNSA